MDTGSREMRLGRFARRRPRLGPSARRCRARAGTELERTFERGLSGRSASPVSELGVLYPCNRGGKKRALAVSAPYSHPRFECCKTAFFAVLCFHALRIKLSMTSWTTFASSSPTAIHRKSAAFTLSQGAAKQKGIA